MGGGSNDEMCEVYFSYVPVKFEDYGKMLGSSFASFEHFYPVEDRVVISDSNLEEIAEKYAKADLWSNQGQIMLISIVESCYADQIIPILNKKKKANKEDLNLRVNLAELTLMQSYFSLEETKMVSAAEKAVSEYLQVLSEDETNWNATMSYGKVLLGSQVNSYMKEGVKQLADLMEYQEKMDTEKKFARVYWELGKYYYGQFDDEKAESVLKRGLNLFPNDLDLLQELASDGRIVKKKLN